MYKWWPKTAPEGLKMKLWGKKDRRHVRTHKREEKSSQTLSLRQSDARERRNVWECFYGAGLREWLGVEQGMGSLHLWWVLQGKKMRNFAKRLRCPQLFKSTLSKWNGMERRLLLDGKKSGILFSKGIDLDVSAPSGKGKVAGMRGEPLLAVAISHHTKSELLFTSYLT